MDIKTTCLAILSRQDATGYEIKKALEEGPFSHIQDAGFGSIYPALGKLHVEGAVTVTELPQNGRPGKKIYSITPTGRMALVDALSAPSAPDRVRSDFLFRMLFADLLSASDLEAMIETRLVELRTAIDRIESCDGPANHGEHFVSGFGLAIYRAMASYLEEHKFELIGSALMLGETANGMAATRRDTALEPNLEAEP